jgi:ferrous iron transport protein A
MMFLEAGSIKTDICDSDQIGPILNSDHSGRSLRVLPFRRPTGVRQVSVLTDLRIGETATLVSLDLPELVQNYLMHMGFVPDAQVTALRRAPAGDPTVYGVDGMEIALRRETADSIRVRSSADTRQNEIKTEPGKIAEKSGRDLQTEIHEYAGATR